MSVRSLSIAILVSVGWGMPALVIAASSWNPTLLVNTESFSTIDDGDGTTNIELRFGDDLNEKMTFNRSAWRFEFSQSIYVGGNITATGSLSIKKVMSGAALRVDNNADIWGKLSVSGATILDGNVSASGALAVEGAAAFGSTIKIGGVTYTFPGSDGSASGKVLKTDGAGNLSWSSDIDTDTNTNAQTLCASDQYLDGDGNCVDVIEESELTNEATLETQLGGINVLVGTELDTFSELQTQISDAVLLNQTTADNRYVNKSGGTMTGSLMIKNGGGLNASGSLLTNTNLTINSDNGAADAVLTFGNDAGAETLKFNDTTNQFELSDDLAITGNASATGDITASGSVQVENNLAVGGTIKLGGVAYTFPGSAGSNGQTLTTSGNGTLTWSAPSVGVGSGGVVFLSPEYPHAVYSGSGTSYIGQLSFAYDATNKENYYHWTSSKADLQEYWIVVRVRVPDNFSAWDANLPVQFRYRTTDASSAVNYASLRMLDTAGAKVTLTGGENLAAASWTTATVTGPQAAGTFTKGGYITLFVKLATTSVGSADAGYINLNWETSAP